MPLLLQTLPDSSLAYVLPSSPGAAVASTADDHHAAATSALLSSASSSPASPATPRQVAAALMEIARGLDPDWREIEGGGEPIGLTDGWQLTSGFDHQGATGAMGSGELWRDDVLDAAKIFSDEEGLAEVNERVGNSRHPSRAAPHMIWRSPLGPRARLTSLRALESPFPAAPRPLQLRWPRRPRRHEPHAWPARYYRLPRRRSRRGRRGWRSAARRWCAARGWRAGSCRWSCPSPPSLRVLIPLHVGAYAPFLPLRSCSCSAPTARAFPRSRPSATSPRAPTPTRR